MNYNILPLFSKPFYVKKLDYIDNVYFNKLLSNIKNQSYKKSDNKFYTTVSKDYSILEKKEFSTLKNHILEEFNFYKNDLLKYNDTDFKITTSWLTKGEKNQISRLHNHTNSMFSGIFYFSVNKNQFNIMFENLYKSMYNIVPREHNIYNSTDQKILVEDKTLILFPSEVHHQILQSKSTKDRYSLAFNIIPTGSYGPENTDSRVNIKVL